MLGVGQEKGVAMLAKSCGVFRARKMVFPGEFVYGCPAVALKWIEQRRASILAEMGQSTWRNC